MERSPRTTFAKATVTTLGALALVGSSFVGTAFATGKAEAPGQAKKADAPAARDHDGDADRSAATSYTEDNDTNDGGTPNNVADAGDNRHPSGKDRSVEHGKSGNQGKAESDPDNDGKGPERNSGGPDKPNGTGGIDKADQDGNNGCGNDDDFEDDNEGWCGRKPHKAHEAKPATSTTSTTVKPAKAAEKPHHHGPKHTETTSCPAGMVDTNGSAAGGCVAPASAPCPTGMVDTNGSAAGGCVPVVTAAEGPCPVGMVDVNGSAAGGCVAPGTGIVSCPAGMVDTNGAESGGCLLPEQLTFAAPATVESVPTGEVLGNSAVAAPTGEVLGAEAVKAHSTARPAVLAAAVSGVSGALAFTGLNALTLLAVALVALAIGFALVRASRRNA